MSPGRYSVASEAPQEAAAHELLLEPSAEEMLQSRKRTISRLRLLWDSRRTLVRVFLCSVVLSTLLVLQIPKRYEAVTRLMPPDVQSGAGIAMLSALAARGGGMSGIAGDLLGVKNSGALFVGILQSRTVQDRVIQQFGLQSLYCTSRMEDVRRVLASNTGVSEDRKNGIISIGVTDRDPSRAAAMAGAYVQELDKLVTEVSTSSARRERIFLQERLQAVKSDLDLAAWKFSEFASKNAAIDIPEQGKTMVEAAAKLQGELIVAESELRGLQAIYTDQNSRVRSLQARVTELRSQLAKLSGSPDAAPAAARQFTSTYPSIRQLPRLGVTYAELFRQTKIEETVFELLTQQYELAKVQEAKEIPSVKVLDAAVVPTKKVSPPRALLIVASTFVCVALTCVLLFAREHWKEIAPQDPGKQFVLEIVQSLQADAARLAPQGSFLRRMISRESPKPGGLQKPESDAVAGKPATTPEVGRAASNSMG